VARHYIALIEQQKYNLAKYGEGVVCPESFADPLWHGLIDGARHVIQLILNPGLLSHTPSCYDLASSSSNSLYPLVS